VRRLILLKKIVYNSILNIYVIRKKVDRNEDSSGDAIDAIITKIAHGSKRKYNIPTDKQKHPHNDNRNDINYDEINFDKLDANTKKTYTDLFSGMPDIYKIVGASHDDDNNTIKKKCNEKMAKYHPDKIQPLLDKCSRELRLKEKND
jgi:DnaJ domain.